MLGNAPRSAARRVPRNLPAVLRRLLRTPRHVLPTFPGEPPVRSPRPRRRTRVTRPSRREGFRLRRPVVLLVHPGVRARCTLRQALVGGFRRDIRGRSVGNLRTVVPDLPSGHFRRVGRYGRCLFVGVGCLHPPRSSVAPPGERPCVGRIGRSCRILAVWRPCSVRWPPTGHNAGPSTAVSAGITAAPVRSGTAVDRECSGRSGCRTGVFRAKGVSNRLRCAPPSTGPPHRSRQPLHPATART